MAPFFVKRLLFAFVLFGAGLFFLRQAPKEEKLWFKPRWLSSGGLYVGGTVALIGASILFVVAIWEAISK